MNRISLPINEIQVIDRQRQDLGDVAALSESLQKYGLIQPIVVNQDKRLIAGGRRLAAATKLGWPSIDVVYRETLTVDELHELELEENVRRQAMSWQERVLNIAQIHRLKTRRSALEGTKWGQQETAEALGMDSRVSVSYSLKIAERLEDKKSPLWQAESMMEAYRLLMREQEDLANAELARRQAEATASFIQEEGVVLADPFDIPQESTQAERLDLDKESAREQYLSNPHNNPEEFEDYYRERMERRSAPLIVPISRMLYKGDSIKFMNENPGMFHHIITDIPYGIDMGMLNQQNPHGGMNDIDTVEKEHDVKENEALMAQFFPAAFTTIKDDGFLITWADQMQWQYMYDLAIKAGFKVQRWPITWVKTHSCMNQTAQFNFTKNTEIAMVCRKGKATLIRPVSNCVVTAGRDELCDALGHPFAKPYAVWEYLTNAVSIEGQTIFEPFAGRGSGVISMLRMRRNVIGHELNEAHYNALLENVKTHHFLKLNSNIKFV